MNYRIIHSDNGTLVDYSYQLNSYHTGSASLSLVAADDKIYVGSLYAFNSIYLDLTTAVGSSAISSIKYWDSSQWRDTVEVIDETDSLQQSGYVTWQVDRQYGWSREDTVNSSGTANITELAAVTIYDMHWIEITVTSDISTIISWVGHILSTDQELFSEYPELSNTNLIGAIESGKTDYEEQSVRASQILIDDLVKMGVIKHSSQLLDRRKLSLANVSKTAEVIYTMLGDDYADQKSDAKKEYKSRINGDLFGIDLNNDADLSLTEQRFSQGYVYK